MAMTAEQRLFYTVAMVGGYYGGYATLRCGILGSAQTANLIELAIKLVGEDWHQVLLHLVAMLIYGAAVALTVVIKHRRPRDIHLISVLIDLVGLGVLACLPREWQGIVTLYPIFFCMAFQWNAFPGACGYTSSSIFSTNNFRQVVLGLTDSLCTKKPEGRKKARFFAGTLFFFHIGVVTAALGIQFLGFQSIWLCAIFLALALVQVRQERRELAEKEAYASAP